MKKDGITNAGKKANELFCETTGFNQPDNPNDKRGDAFEDNIWCEVKKDTYNQVRPWKYNVLVGYDTEKDQWYVIPADEVVLDLCLTKAGKGRRGQHTPDQVICVNLGEVNSKMFDEYKVETKNLRSSVISAYLQGEKNVLVKDYAKKTYEEHNKLNITRGKEIKLLKEKIDAQTRKQRLP